MKRKGEQLQNDNTTTVAGATPLLALDVYEHAYALDFGAKAGDYVDGFMRSTWENGSRLFAGLPA
jgi:Fe-Mn family superoxide dismutase